MLEAKAHQNRDFSKEGSLVSLRLQTACRRGLDSNPGCVTTGNTMAPSVIIRELASENLAGEL